MGSGNKGRSVGIDLGTTNSVVSYIDEKGQPQVIASSEGGRTIPSVFAVTKDGAKLVGRSAVDQEVINSDNTVRSVKRTMGYSTRFSLQGKEYSPEEISAEILKKIKHDAEMFLGESVTEAVITVPAYFDAHKRQCTKTAGELAGLNVLRVINEPTAAALAYGLGKKKDEIVLVYDLGGGTFDVTILQITPDGLFEVISTAGDDQLGGDDFDEILMSMIEEHLPDTIVNLHTSQYSRVRDAAEKAKFQLSATDAASILIPYFTIQDGVPINIECTLLKKDFEERISSLIEKTIACVNQALEDANLSPSEINEVVLVGGSTRVPAVVEAIKAFTNKIPNRTVNPDEAVALGAAVQAAILSGERERDVLLLDVIPLSLGVETDGGVMTVMVERNTPIPTEFKETFTTFEDYQEIASVKVYQGERPRAIDNRLLGNFTMDLDPSPRGVPQIEITYSVDANGILSVTAKDKTTDQEKTVTITGNDTLSQDEIAQMLADAKANEEYDRHFKEVSDLKSLLKDRLTSAESILRDSSSALDEDVIKSLKTLVEAIEDALSSEDVSYLQSLAESADEDINATLEVLYSAAEEQIVQIEANDAVSDSLSNR